MHCGLLGILTVYICSYVTSHLLTCIKEWISLIAMLSYTVFVTVYIQVSWFSSHNTYVY